jgi:hypothetical protein
VPRVLWSADFDFGTWERAWLEAARLADRERRVLVLDAFT